ncbi:DUF1761 domain-containing protein [Alloacidobacterium dinghuense]|uniref:DUF1761 domain-containing protein n=1 Tax=Alloacidobacterium dinghuense TaxID=2763107 RepID=A0A7G8BM23_9BACT|nr:DUF1761 domain-containing protein [Alloacidobacterium dinghuense]QNI33593.1 DUF1761 domain-containing protein [Alloacidobacterium dinghuense]
MLETRKVRLNYLAILVSALVYFGMQAVWFTVFMNEWLAGIGKTAEQLHQEGASVALAYLIAFFADLVMAAAISWFTQMTGKQNVFRGAMVAIVAWIGFVLTTWSAEYAFEEKGLRILAVNTGISLIGMVVMGVILGAWKAKSTTIQVDAV